MYTVRELMACTNLERKRLSINQRVSTLKGWRKSIFKSTILHFLLIFLTFVLRADVEPIATMMIMIKFELFFVYFFGGLECCWPLLCLCFPFCIFRAAVASRRATNSATHLPSNLAIQLPCTLAIHLPCNLATHFPCNLATHLPCN